MGATNHDVYSEHDVHNGLGPNYLANLLEPITHHTSLTNS